MPFGIKLKRTGRYILSHKNSFLIQVQLLDNTVMECTLTVENTGTDCLNAVANRLELRETKYFGLNYFSKQRQLRWVELDKPLKKQVDKNALDPILYFSVMYYIANIEILHQEITRYLFYLQLKNNVIEGILPCTKENAIELASYMLQAEFGDHDPEIHVVEYFRDYILFSRALAPDEDTLDILTKQTLEQHERHRGLSAADSEYNYILKVIHLDGFSEEVYPAKNAYGQDVEIGSSFVGIVIKGSNGVMCHEWVSVGHISPSKNAMSVEIKNEDSTINNKMYYLEDTDLSKFICRIMDLRRKFYLQNKDIGRKLSLENLNTSVIQRHPTIRRHHELNTSELSDQAVVSIQTGYISSQENLHDSFNGNKIQYSSQNSLDHVYISQNSLNQPTVQDMGYTNGYVVGGSMYSSPSVNSLAHSQMTRPSPATSNLSINSSDRRGVMGISPLGVPIYRPSPDYDQALRQRRRFSSYLENNSAVHGGQNPHHINSVNEAKPRPHSMIYSQQELNQASHGVYQSTQHPQLYYRHSQPPTESVPARNHPWDASHESLSPPTGSHLQIYPGGPTFNEEMTGSSPELANPIFPSKHLFVSEIQLHKTNPPPPYINAGSTSTPDLSRNNVSASSPNLHMGQTPIHHPLHPLPQVEGYTEKKHNCYNQVQAYLQQVNLNGQQQQHETSHMQQQNTYTEPHAGSREHLNVSNHAEQFNHVEQFEHFAANLQESDLRQQRVNEQKRINEQQMQYADQWQPLNDRRTAYNEKQQKFHPENNMHYHSKEPSNATMLVHSSDEDDTQTPDYLLSQQVQENALREVQRRVTRSSEFLSEDSTKSPQVTVQNLVQSLQNLNSRPPPPSYPRPPGGNPTTRESPLTRGPPPPYHNQGPGDNYEEIEGECLIEDENSSESFQHARRNTIRKMAPMKLASMSGLTAGDNTVPTNGTGPPSPVKGEPDERVLNLEAKVEEGHLLSEYDQIPRTRSENVELASTASRDRVKEVTPYSDWRIEITRTSENPHGYINASLLSTQIVNEDWQYIACQTLMEGYQHEFWDMVWLNKVTIVVLLTKEVELGKSRCACYWPNSDDNQDIPTTTFGDFKVMCRFENVGSPGDCRITRNLVLERRGSSEKRTVWMLHYLGWPETGVPKDTDNFSMFTEELLSVRRLTTDSTGPVVVQCASGSGRTGVLILSELMIQCLERNEEITVPEMLERLRQQRIHLVQTYSQYNFVYKLIISFLRKSRLI